MSVKRFVVYILVAIIVGLAGGFISKLVSNDFSPVIAACISGTVLAVFVIVSIALKKNNGDFKK
jgi:thiamine transporter ThiT